MRKRDRERFSKKLAALLDDLNHHAANQLSGAIWYFENGAEGKGYSFAYGASNWASDVGERIKKFLDEELKKPSKRKKRKT
jgi:hypothetical protein